jgi:MinD superfamily P-loop ATPase
MKATEVAIISGKGGTGKTSLTAAFAALSENKVLADCDVDAANLHIVMNPNETIEDTFSNSKVAEIMTDKCTGCGKCMELCRYEAISRRMSGNGTGKETYVIDPVSCEGCGVCAWFCEDKAIRMKESINGTWYISETPHGPMVHARLGIAEENSGKLVSLVRNNARRIAGERNLGLILIDGPPGIGCPVISSITGADMVVIVTEPTLSGSHDLDRAAKLAEHFGIPSGICINKWDINPVISEKIEKRAKGKGIKLLGRIRYDNVFTEAQVKRCSVVEVAQSPAADDIRDIWKTLSEEIEKKG